MNRPSNMRGPRGKVPELDPLHAMQFRASQVAQVRHRGPAQRPSPSDRDCPLHTARDRCLWHVGGTAGEDDSVLRGAVGPTLTAG
jgi:hypothetical protein